MMVECRSEEVEFRKQRACPALWPEMDASGRQAAASGVKQGKVGALNTSTLVFWLDTLTVRGQTA
jgi:hypothetical protein